MEKVKTFTVDPTQFNNTCYIVGGGPSLKEFDWSLLKGKFVIAINRAYEVLPDAQIVYFTDEKYWKVHKTPMLKHTGQLIRGSLLPNKEEQNPSVILYKLTGENELDTTPGCLRHGNNSTYAALNLAAVHLKFKRIYLLGVDMKWGESKNESTSHWHNGYAKIDEEVAYRKMIKAFKTIVNPLTNLGVKVYNANPDSALNCFPKVTLEEALTKEIF